MADLTKDELKAIFKAGAIPTEAQFASLIESQINKKDTGSLILSASSIDISGSAIAKTDIDLLKQGKSISSPTITSGSTSAEDNINYTQYLRPEAVISDSDTSTYTKYTTPGRMGTFISGTLFFDLNKSSSNNYIALGATNSKLRLTGNITSSGNISASGTIIANSIIGTSTTFTNITASGAISASRNLIVGGTSALNGDITVPKTVKLYFDGPSGLHIYSEGTATDENQVILAKTNNLRILNQAHGKDIIFGTENASGTAKTPLTLSGSGDATFGGGITVTGTTTFSSAQVGQRLTIKNLTGTSETLTAAESGKLCLFSDADGAIVTLPDSGDGSLVGVYYDFYVSVAATSNVHRINVADTTNEDIEGYLHVIDGDNAAAQATVANRALNSDGFDAISMDGTTTGTVGTNFRITNIAADRWYTTGHLVATGTPSTPFVAS